MKKGDEFKSLYEVGGKPVAGTVVNFNEKTVTVNMPGQGLVTVPIENVTVEGRKGKKGADEAQGEAKE